MPTSRPSAPATLSTTNAVALNALGVWLADADVDTPDLTSHAQPNAVRTGSPTFGTSVLGGEFKPSTDPSYLVSHSVTSISAFPVVIGAIFSRAGTKTGGSGFEVICSLGDSTQPSSSTYCALAIDDGGQVGNSHVVGNLRSQLSGNVSLVDLGVYTPGGTDAAVIVYYLNAGARTVAAFFNGTKVFDAAPATDCGAFISDVMNYFSALARVRAGTNDLNASTSLSAALWWYSNTKLTDGDYTTWTGDPWLILQASGAAPQKAYPISDDSVGSWQRKGPGTEAARNLLTYTESLDNAAWTKSACTITADGATDPNGASTADVLVETVTNALHYVTRSFSFASGNTYGLSVHAAPNGRNWIFLYEGSIPSYAFFNVSTGVVGTSSNCTPTIVSAGNGLYRCEMVWSPFTSTAGFIICASDSDNNLSGYLGVGNAVNLWGAQLELASSISAYQPILATTPPLEVSSSNVFTALADGSTGTPDDSSYAFVLVPGDPYWFKFGPTTLPISLTGSIPKVRCYSPQSRSMQFDIYQGYLGTLIATRTINLTASVAESDLSLTDPELALVTDLTDIHGRMMGL